MIRKVKKLKVADISSPENKTMHIFWSLIFLLFALLSQASFDEQDTYFLLNHGEYIFKNGFPVIEPFSMHENLSFIIPQWLTSVIIYGTCSLFGITGLYLLKVLFISASLYIIYKLSMLVSNDNYNVSCITTLAFAFVSRSFFSLRPYLFTTVIFLLELYFLEKYKASSSFKYLISLPLLSLLLINFAAAVWFMFFVLILPYIAENLFLVILKKKAPIAFDFKLCIIFIVSLLMGPINPYGLTAVTYLFRSYGHEEINSLVTEMHSPLDVGSVAIPFLATLTAIILLFIFSKNRDYKIRYFLLFLGTLLLSFMQFRNTLMWAIAGIFTVAYYIKDCNITFNLKSKKNLRFAKKLCVLMLVMVISLLPIRVCECAMVSPEFHVAEKAVDYLIENEEASDIKLYCHPLFGPYVNWRGLKAFIDTRFEVYTIENNKQSDILYDFYCLNHKIHYRDFIEKYQFTHFLIHKQDSFYIIMVNDADFTCVYEDENFVILEPTLVS